MRGTSTPQKEAAGGSASTQFAAIRERLAGGEEEVGAAAPDGCIDGPLDKVRELLAKYAAAVHTARQIQVQGYLVQRAGRPDSRP
ncbi:hypothetical protein TARUN_8329 [Trichoderma arundinaceum]|uniref:Uncharacterized protein n=1 Tax=Trichoderma arundinaceum TaxID=490622 RepID=A0A395NCW8_TRIAR|nr:hypothetical protein TARUN_8329 [Trichoderma arundinaceum]